MYLRAQAAESIRAIFEKEHRLPPFKDLVMGEDLVAQIHKGLADTGYPLELGVGRQLQLARWYVNYSRWYRDAQRQTNRHVDVEALVFAAGASGHAAYSLAIECKRTNKHPWIGLHSDGYTSTVAPRDVAAGQLTQHVMAAAETLKITTPSLLEPGLPLVDGLIQAFGKPEEDSPTAPYSALRQALSGALGLDDLYLGTAVGAHPDLSMIAVLLPVVIFDGPLFTYSLSPVLSGIVKEVPVIVARLPSEVADRALMIPVMTPQFAESKWKPLRQKAHDFCVAMVPHTNAVLSSLMRGQDFVVNGGES